MTTAEREAEEIDRLYAIYLTTFALVASGGSLPSDGAVGSAAEALAMALGANDARVMRVQVKIGTTTIAGLPALVIEGGQLTEESAVQLSRALEAQASGLAGPGQQVVVVEALPVTPLDP